MFLEYDLYILPFNNLSYNEVVHVGPFTIVHWQLKILFKTQPLAIII